MWSGSDPKKKYQTGGANGFKYTSRTEGAKISFGLTYKIEQGCRRECHSSLPQGRIYMKTMRCPRYLLYLLHVYQTLDPRVWFFLFFIGAPVFNISE